MGGVLKVLVRTGPSGIHFLGRDPYLSHGHFGGWYFEQHQHWSMWG